MTSPVTQNADAAVNKASINGVGRPDLEETGMLSRNAPSIISSKVPSTIISV